METLIVTRDNGIVEVTMNRPQKKNAANGIMFEELASTFRAIAENKEDRCLVLTGAEGNFCTGADLSDPRGATMDMSIPGITRMRRLNEIALALQQIAIPAIAKVDGLAVGAGMSLALGCDLVVASSTAKFSMIFAKRGLSPDMGASWLLPRQVGMAKAKELMFFADMISAEEGLALGFVNSVVDSGELDATVSEMATKLATGPTIALSFAKSLLNQSYVTSFAQSLEHEGQAQAINFDTEDTREAIMAFLEKRDPHFKGR